jgi:hypothetical protein
VTTKLKRTLALVFAGGALAIGVPAALAAGGDGASTSNAPSTPSFIQDEGGQNGQNRPDDRRGDCPEKDGGSGSQGSSAETTEL